MLPTPTQKCSCGGARFYLFPQPVTTPEVGWGELTYATASITEDGVGVCTTWKCEQCGRPVIAGKIERPS